MIQVLPSGVVTLDHLRVQGGFVSLAGTAGGGGIFDEGALAIVDSEIVGNQAQGGDQPVGGGIYTTGSLSSLSIDRSTIANNVVQMTGGGQALGGGIADWPVGAPGGTLTMLNSTVTGNTAAGNNFGIAKIGGVFAGDTGNFAIANLTHTTITGNQATGNSSMTGGLMLAGGTLTGDLIAGNTEPTGAADCYQQGGSTGGGNLIGDGTCKHNGANDLGGTQQNPINPNLGLLLDNGGPTRTLLPNPGSPAIDRGGSCLTTDQRGFFRGSVPPCDAGAVEVGAGGSPEALVAMGLRARLEVKGKVKVKRGPHGRFLVLTGIDASCPTAGVRCTGAASVNAVGGSKRLAAASRRSKSLGKTALSLAAGQSQLVKITLTKKGSKAIKKAGKLRARITVELNTLGGTPTVLSRKAKLKPPRSGRRSSR